MEKALTTKSKSIISKKTMNMITTGIAVVMVVLIGIFIFFKFVPGYNFYVVRSGSMVPTIGVGNIIFTGPVGDVAPGKIITFDFKGETVTHRIQSIQNGQITTKGDANKSADTSTITLADIKGGYMFQVPGLGYITNFAGTKNGWFIMVIIPAVLLVLFLVKDILKEAFKNDKKKNEGFNSQPVGNMRLTPEPAMAAAAPVYRSQPAQKVSRPQSSKKSIFSFLMFDDEGSKTAVLERPAPRRFAPAAAPIKETVTAQKTTPVAAQTKKKAGKSSLFSFLAFNDESQPAVKTAKAPVKTSSAVEAAEAIVVAKAAETQATLKPVEKAAVSPESVEATAEQPIIKKTYQGLSWLEFATQPAAPEKKAAAESVKATSSEPVKNAVDTKDNTAAAGTLFNNKELEDNVKNELKKILANYN